MSSLDEALRLFYRNFNRCFKKDILVFHNGSIPADDQKRMRKQHGPELKFHHLKPGSPVWTPPAAFPKPDSMSDADWSDRLGFYFLNRWNSALIYDYVAALEYQWLMRIEHDSRFLSCINYDMFAQMEAGDYAYAHRLEAFELGLGQGIGNYPSYLQIGFGGQDAARQKAPERLLARFQERSLNLTAWDGRIYYNNFFITKLAFWKQPPARALLQLIDDSRVLFEHEPYMKRILDAPLQTLIVSVLLPESRVLRFNDWSYCHFPMAVVTLMSLLPGPLARLAERLGIPNYEWQIGIDRRDEIEVAKDLHKLIGHDYYRFLQSL